MAFEAPVVLEFVKTYISDGGDPHLWIAGANDLPVPEITQGFTLPVDDILSFYGLNIVGVPEMHAEYKKFMLERQVISDNPYADIPSPSSSVLAEVQEREEQQASTAGNAGSSSAPLDQQEPIAAEQASYLQWLEQALRSKEFDYVGHDKSVYNVLFSSSLAIVLNNYEKLGTQDPTVESIKQQIQVAELVEPNKGNVFQGEKIWTRTGERLVGELQQALNKFYYSKQMKLLKYDLRNLEKGEASYRKLPQPGSELFENFIQHIGQTHLEARLHKLKAEARSSQPATGSYFKRTPRIQQLAMKLGLD